MADKSYFLRVLRGASFEKLNSVLETVHQRTGRNKLSILLDILHCTKKYGSGYFDYQIFAFYDLTEEQRATYVTRTVSRDLNMFLNDPNYTHLFDNKVEFNRLFSKYVKRGCISLETASKEDVRAFAEGKESLFAKPLDGECGHGCELLRPADFADFDALYDYLKNGGFHMVEDVIRQHPDVAKLHPSSVNCTRIITLLDDEGEPHCLYVVQKIGLNGSIIDNNCMFAPLDWETGEYLFSPHSGDTTKGIIYEKHPNSHITLKGYKIPFVKEAIAMCLEAAKVVPQVRYVGWDVAITPDGPEFVEGNTFCAHDFWQLPPHTPSKTGMLPTIMQYAKGFRR